MAKLHKIASAAFMSALMMCITTNCVQAEENPESVVENYVYAMDTHSWDDFTELYCSEEQAEMQAFFDNPTNADNHIGVLNVESAELLDLVEIDLQDAQDMLYKEYSADETKVYVFGVDYDVHEDSKYFSTGVNYNFITCVKEDGTWKVSEMLPIAEPDKLIELGYEFSDGYDITINVMDARRNGYLMNYDGDVFATLNGETALNSASTYAIINQRTIPTDDTVVRYRDSEGNVTNIPFHDYCLGVLAVEVRGTSFNGTVRQAQAIATKTFTWHYVIVPHGGVNGYDINNVQQAYRPDKVTENAKVTEDYNAVKNVWMESYEGYIFTAYYKAGVYAEQSSYKNGGDFKQNGARWLYDNGVATTYKALLKYYYDDSSVSDGAIRFFDNNKNELY